MLGYKNSRLFCGGYLSAYIDSLLKKIEEKIYSYGEDYILNVNEDDFVAYIKSIFTVECPKLKTEEAGIEKDEKEIEIDPPFRYDHVRKIKKKILIIRYCIPIEGNSELLQYQANHMSFWIGGGPDRVYWYSSCLYAEFEDYYQNPQNVRSSIDSFQERLLHNLGCLKDQLETDYNNLLEKHAFKALQSYKQQIKGERDYLEAIKIPLRNKKDTPTTFAIPSPKVREKIKITCPVVKDSRYKPEPTLDWARYQKILNLINDVGKNFERLPSVAGGKQEEDLRDHILLTIDPNFEMGSASGETFNKTGKTDIQIRYDSSVVFIAECKFWTGEKNYLKTIDQLLNYLTWRDSKTAVVIFSKKKDFTNVLSKIREVTPKHLNFLKEKDQQSETWFNYKFHINGDRNREIDLAILAFNIPEMN